MTEFNATLWGMENGEIVCPVIHLWKTRKGVMEADNLSGAVKHGQRVEVKQIDDDGWVEVYRMVVHKGKEYPQEGWVKKSLIKFDSDNE